MKQLSKADVITRTTCVDALSLAAEEVSDAFADYLAAVETYNEKLAEAREWRDAAADVMALYYQDRSEKWQEGEAGQAYLEWQQAYEGLNLDDVDLPVQIELGHDEPLDELPDGPLIG